MREDIPPRTLASLTRLERLWLKRRYCAFCEAPCLGTVCYAYSGEYVLPVIEGVRDKEEVTDLGPPCDMDKKRGAWLQSYRPRPPLPIKPHPKETIDGVHRT